MERRQFLKRALGTAATFAAVGWAIARRRPVGSGDFEATIYAAVDRDVGEPILRAYEAATGRRLLAVYDSEAAKTVGLAKSLEIEADAPRADLWWSGESLYTAILARKGLLEPLGGFSIGPGSSSDPAARFLPIARRLRVLCFRKDAESTSLRPKTYADLADPRRSGRVAIAKASVGSTATQMLHWASHEKGRALLESIAAARPLMVSGNSRAVLAVRHRQADLALTDTDDVFLARTEDPTIDWIAPARNEESGAALAIDSSIGFVRGSRNRAAAEAFVAWLFEKEAQEIITRASGGAWSIRRPELTPPGQSPLDPASIEIPDAQNLARRHDELRGIVASIFSD